MDQGDRAGSSRLIEQVKAKGLDGAKLIAAARALVAKYEKA